MPVDPTLRLGFIGLGAMGNPMTRQLVSAGWRPVLHDIDLAAADALAAELSLDVASDPATLGATSDVVILMLPTSEIVRRVCLGDAGLASTLTSGALIVDMSSSDPMETRRLGASLAAQGVSLLDAPVSGGVRKAEAGTLAILLGGPDGPAVDRAAGILAAMGAIHRTGDLGSGHATKALNNYVSAAGLAAACEAMLIGEAFGLDPRRLIDAINASTGRNNSTENKMVPFVLSGEFRKAGFALDLMAKDVGLAAGLADGLGLDLPGVAATARLWREAQASLGPGADHTEIYRHLDKTGRNDVV